MTKRQLPDTTKQPAPPSAANGRPGADHAPDHAPDQAAPAGPARAPSIHPRQVFTLGQAAAVLGLKPSCLPREIRKARLRSAKRAGKRLILGRWLLEWIEGGAESPVGACTRLPALPLD